MTTKLTEELLGKVQAHVALGAGVSGVTRREALIALDDLRAALGAAGPAPDANAPRPDPVSLLEAERDCARFERNAWQRACEKAEAALADSRSYVPQKLAKELIDMLEASGLGTPGNPNTLWAMTKEAAEAVKRAAPPRSEAPPDAREEEREREATVVQGVVESLAFGEVPTCECGKDAVCVGWTEGRLETLAVMCDDCCGHGNEDGWCVPLAKFYPSKRGPRSEAGRETPCDDHRANGPDPHPGCRCAEIDRLCSQPNKPAGRSTSGTDAAPASPNVCACGHTHVSGIDGEDGGCSDLGCNCGTWRAPSAPATTTPGGDER